jgi:hypothetical protein
VNREFTAATSRPAEPERDGSIPPAALFTTVRRTSLLLQEFRSRCQLNATAPRLALALKAVIGCAGNAFLLACQDERGASRFSIDNETCLLDLLELLGALDTRAVRSPFDLAHAMDALLIQLVRIEAAPRGAACLRRPARATAH